MAVKTYSLRLDGGRKLSANFTVREFRSKCGSDQVLVDEALVILLQKIRDHFGKAITINSAYRTAAHNKKVGGSTKSQHLLGTAADIAVSGVTPLAVAQYAESLGAGGIGLYGSFTHVDTRAGKVRWDQRSGTQVAVTGFGGTVPVEKEDDDLNEAQTRAIVAEMLKGSGDTPSAWAKEAWEWAKKNGVTDGTRPQGYTTREQMVVMMYRTMS